MITHCAPETVLKRVCLTHCWPACEISFLFSWRHGHTKNNVYGKNSGCSWSCTIVPINQRRRSCFFITLPYQGRKLDGSALAKFRIYNIEFSFKKPEWKVYLNSYDMISWLKINFHNCPTQGPNCPTQGPNCRSPMQVAGRICQSDDHRGKVEIRNKADSQRWITQRSVKIIHMRIWQSWLNNHVHAFSQSEFSVVTRRGFHDM